MWYGFTPRSQIFESVAPVVHYNTFSRLIMALFVRLFGTPGVAYVDDFGFVIFEGLRESALKSFVEFFGLLGSAIFPTEEMIRW